MTRLWFDIMKSLHHKPNAFDAHNEPAAARSGCMNSHRQKTSTCWRFGCSGSISNLKDVVHGQNRRLKPPSASVSSPRSPESSDSVDPPTHKAVVYGSGNGGNCLKIAAAHSGGSFRSYACGDRPLAGSPAFKGNGRDAFRIFPGLRDSCPLLHNLSGSEAYGAFYCYYCGQDFKARQTLEDHHLCNHAVTELEEGEHAAKIVEKICQSGFSNSNNGRSKILAIKRILKVQHTQQTLAKFEEYRESVKARASKLQSKHSRCIADGNELLRFHGTTVTCSLSTVNGCQKNLCSFPSCDACRIIKKGFSTRWQMKGRVGGVFTASASRRAFESIGGGASSAKAVLVCRVIAGRVHKPVDKLQEMTGLAGFDSVAGKGSWDSNIEELYLFSPRALLPCFVVICESKPSGSSLFLQRRS